MKHPSSQGTSQLYKDIPIGLCHIDTELKIVDINPWLATLNSRSVGECLGRSFGDALPGIADGMEPSVHQAIETNKSVIDEVIEAATPSRPGFKRTLRYSCVPVQSESDSVIGVTCTIEDVTALVDTPRVLKALVENIGMGISEWDEDLRLVYASGTMEKMLGFPDDMFVPGVYMGDLFRFLAEKGEYGEGDVEELVRERVELAMRFEPHVFERLCKDGTVFEIRGAPMPRGGFVSTHFDITMRKRAEDDAREAQEELLKQQRRATELAESKLAESKLAESKLNELSQQLVQQTRLATIGQMTASIAHEIRNPLGVLRSATYYLKRHVLTDEPKILNYLNIIDHEVHAVDQVVRNMLQMARAKDPDVESFDLALTIREVFECMNAVAAVRIDLVSNPDPFMILADPGQCYQVIFNLVTNAVHAVDGNGEIRVEIWREDDHDMITVKDDGPGVGAEHRDKLFEPLFTTKAKGSGLGLSICRQIIERHGGTIELRDHEGSGAQFCVRLPHCLV
jgi:signal transduction histidine kinase